MFDQLRKMLNRGQQAPQQQQPQNPNKPIGMINGKQYNYGGDFLPLQQPQMPLQVQQNPGMQPFGPRQEDDYTETQALQPTDFRAPQVSRHGMFEQNGGQPQQGILSPQSSGNPANEILRRLLRY